MIITLCGSTKFQKFHEQVMETLTLEGHIVIGCGVYGHQKATPLDDLDKALLDRLHLKKIDMADEIFVVNPYGYIGSSTEKEIAYATEKGKPIRYYHDNPQFVDNPPVPLKMYDASGTISYDSLHTILLKFQYGEHTAQVVTEMGGNTFGADLLSGYDDIENLTAPIDHPINKKHCMFEKSDDQYQYIDFINFFHPTRQDEVVPVSEVGEYLIGVEIIDYKANRNE